MALPTAENEGSDEGAILTIPTNSGIPRAPGTKKLKKYKRKPRNKRRRHQDVKVKDFIQKYKLESIAKPIYNEGLTIDFLMAQSDADINAISSELTPKPIQQKKFKFAVSELKKLNAKSTKTIIEPKAPIALKKPEIMAIDMKVEQKSKAFGNNKTITSWYYNGCDSLRHEIILKHHTKTTKNLTSKRSILVDGTQRYAKKSNNMTFVIQECADDLRIEITHGDDAIFYELYINNVAFTELMNPQVQSFSL